MRFQPDAYEYAYVCQGELDTGVRKAIVEISETNARIDRKLESIRASRSADMNEKNTA